MHTIDTLRIQSTELVAEGVKLFRLVAPHDETLPAWQPGSHLEISLPSGRVRHYSLCGPLQDDRVYEIAVLREPGGRGGSQELYDDCHPGDLLKVRGPINRFPLVQAEGYVFIAGGIGITPILPMIRQLATGKLPWWLVYGGRTRRSMAFAAELSDICPDRVLLVPEDEQGRLRVGEALNRVSAGWAAYCCGPPGLIDAVETECRQRHLTLHIERFRAPATPQNTSGDEAIEVELQRSGQTILVPPDMSILDAVREVVPGVPSSCEEGFCGSCEAKVIAGIPEHRDSILSEREREENATMMICVGRARTRKLVLDL